MTRKFYISTLIILTLFSCKSVEKMVKNGEYDKAILFSLEKLQGGEEDRKTKYVVALEDAFSRVMAQDLHRLEYLIDKGAESDYFTIWTGYDKIVQRQNKVRPYLPLISEDGYVATFKMVDVRQVIVDYKNRDAAYHYAEAEDLLLNYTESDKEKARSAHRHLTHISRYYPAYKETESLLVRSEQLGKEYVYLDIDAPTHLRLDRNSLLELTDMGLSRYDKKWLSFDDEPRHNTSYDYKVTLHLEEIAIGRESEHVHTYVKETSIEDGFKYVLDTDGNVAKDSLGNDIKEPRIIDIRASITEVERNKSAAVAAFLTITDLHRSDVLNEIPLDTEVHFSGFSCVYIGDKRALNNEVNKRLDTYLEQFPRDYDMVEDALDKIKRNARGKIKKAFS